MRIAGVIRYLFRDIFGGPRMLKSGDAAPDFEAQAHDGRKIKLADLRGKKIVLWFYPKADTSG